MCIVMVTTWEEILLRIFFFRCGMGVYIRPPQPAGNIRLTLDLLRHSDVVCMG